MTVTRFADHITTGNHAGRPAATTLPVGSLYSCTTHSLVYQTDGVAWSTWATLGGGGVTDHGALTGLADDDHPAAPSAALSEESPTKIAWLGAPAAPCSSRSRVRARSRRPRP